MNAKELVDQGIPEMMALRLEMLNPDPDMLKIIIEDFEATGRWVDDGGLLIESPPVIALEESLEE